MWRRGGGEGEGELQPQAKGKAEEGEYAEYACAGGIDCQGLIMGAGMIRPRLSLSFVLQK